MAITHATSTGPIGETQWLENHTVDAAALRTHLNVADGATANATDAHLLARANHTGNQAIATVTGLQDELDNKLVAASIDTLAKLNALIADATILKDADIGSTVQAYDANTAKLDVAQTWTATQSFTTVTGSAVTITSPGTAQSVALDGRTHVIELADGTETTITGTPTGSGYSSAIVRIKGSAAGTGTIAWPAGHVQMNSQALNAAAGAYSDFMLDSHDGSTVLYRGVGVEP